ncbi:hypothetical protein Tco_0862752, partial [Tanacetum coccineum]
MANLSEDIQCAGSDTRPPMLDKADFASWQQRIRLYCRGKDNGVNILKSIDEGPFQMGTTRVTVAEGTEGSLNLGPERPRVYSDLSQDEKDRYNADIRATNIILQGLPKDIYSLINHYTDAKDIWDNVKMLLEGSELTKEDRESQLYDDFEHFRQNKGETIHDYYVRFAKLINDMRNIKMTMSKIQLNSKFVNNMLPEWGRFVTAATCPNENKMMLERLTQQTVDPLALMSNVSPQHYHSQSSTIPPTTYHQPHSADTSQSDLGLSPTDNLIENLTNTLALLTQSYKTFLPQTNNQLRTSSNPRNQATVQDGRVVVQNVQGRQNRGQGNNARGTGAAGYGGAQNRVGNANPGQARQDNAIDEDVDEQPVQDLALNVDNVFQADDCDAYDSDVDEAPMAQTMFMTNLSSADPVCDEAGPSYDSDILSEVHDHDHFQDAICEHHEEHGMQDDVQPSYIVGSHADYTSDSNMTPVIIADNSLNTELAYTRNKLNYERRARFELTERNKRLNDNLRIGISDRKITEENLKNGLQFCKIATLPYASNNKQLMVDEVTSLKKDFNQKENKYLEEFLDLKALKDKVEDKLFKQGQSIQTVHMMCKPRSYYDEVNKVAYGYKKLPLCLHRARQAQPALYSGHVIVTPNHAPAVVRDGEETLELTKISRKKMHEKMKANECVDNKVLTKEVKEMSDAFDELEAELDQSIVDRKHDEIERKNLLIEHDNIIADGLSKEVFYVASNSELNVFRFTEMQKAHHVVKARCLELEAELSNLRDDVRKDNYNDLLNRFSNLEVNHLNLQLKYQNLKDSFQNKPSSSVNDTPDFNSVFMIGQMKASLQGKDNVIQRLKMQISQFKETRSELDRTLDFRARDFQISQLTDKVKPNVLAPGKYAIDVEPIPPRNRNNREVHLVYLRHLKESVDTLHKIVEERSLAFACRYTKHSQELLEYVFGTCLKVFNQQDKKHAHTPRKKQVGVRADR